MVEIRFSVYYQKHPEWTLDPKKPLLERIRVESKKDNNPFNQKQKNYRLNNSNSTLVTAAF